MEIHPVIARQRRYALVLPALVALLVIAIFPFIFGFVMSFRSATLANYRIAPWTGLGNYRLLFHDYFFWNSLYFTIKFTFTAVFIEVVLGTALAIFYFSARFPLKQTLFIGMIIPMMVAPIFYGVSLKLALNSLYGIIPWIFQHAGLQIDFFRTSQAAFWTIISADTWQWTSFVFLLVYSGLQSVPHETIEAATVDGVTSWQMIWKILLPQVLPILGVASLLRVIDAFKIFDVIFVITGGGPGVSTRSASLQTWYYMFGQFNLGAAAAYTIVFAIVVYAGAQILIKGLVKE